MKTKNILCCIVLFFSTAAFAQENDKYILSFPPPELLKSGKTYHFEGEKNGLKIKLELKRKTAMSTKYAMKIEYPDKRIVTGKGIVYMRKTYDFGSEELLKESDDVMISCQSFTSKKQTETGYLEICIGDDENKNGKETGKIFVSFLFGKTGYPDINPDNTPELIEL